MLLYVYYFQNKDEEDPRQELAIYSPSLDRAKRRFKKLFGYEGEFLRRENW